MVWLRSERQGQQQPRPRWQRHGCVEFVEEAGEGWEWGHIGEQCKVRRRAIVFHHSLWFGPLRRKVDDDGVVARRLRNRV